MNCQNCQSPAKKFGKDRDGHQRFRCTVCKKTFIESYDRPLGDMRLPIEKAILVLTLLVEGNSIRAIERITKVEKRTILSLLAFVGERCEMLFENLIHGIAVSDVQCDEIWGFVGKKEKTKTRQGEESNQIGDAWCFTAMERHSKLILAWHLGRRTMSDTVAFTEKLARATEGHHNFQITTDGFAPYRDAIVLSLGAQLVNFAQLVKLYSANPENASGYTQNRPYMVTSKPAI